GQQGFPCESGWACHLYSGLGELLGMFASLADGPLEPGGVQASRIESACHLAVLAIEQKNLIDELSFRANHDSLTGLTNRTRYERELRAAVRTMRGRMVALLHAGLDRFRLVNDVLGQSVGN